ncbi:unnamed protein product [Trichogramma brassicae]|uniref:Reverse transcriptase RNase H-like domain-containing protein n=1 Tax=Trichogramma brassicae TaxID=86971 RepID=A0A6H5HU79_9HYME|nr:unnamed protein product [Trichogramma brassicae]
MRKVNHSRRPKGGESGGKPDWKNRRNKDHFQKGRAAKRQRREIRCLSRIIPVFGLDAMKEYVECVQTEASDTSLGAVLLQNIDGEERVLEVASRELSHVERNYTAPERECLGVIWAIRKFRSYIEGYEFTLVTDRASLRASSSARHSPLQEQAYCFRMSINSAPDNKLVCCFSIDLFDARGESRHRYISRILDRTAQLRHTARLIEQWYNNIVSKIRAEIDSTQKNPVALPALEPVRPQLRPRRKPREFNSKQQQHSPSETLDTVDAIDRRAPRVKDWALVAQFPAAATSPLSFISQPSITIHAQHTTTTAAHRSTATNNNNNNNLSAGCCRRRRLRTSTADGGSVPSQSLQEAAAQLEPPAAGGSKNPRAGRHQSLSEQIHHQQQQSTARICSKSVHPKESPISQDYSDYQTASSSSFIIITRLAADPHHHHNLQMMQIISSSCTIIISITPQTHGDDAESDQSLRDSKRIDSAPSAAAEAAAADGCRATSTSNKTTADEAPRQSELSKCWRKKRE